MISKEQMLRQVDQAIEAGLAVRVERRRGDLGNITSPVDWVEFAAWKSLAIATAAAVVPSQHPLSDLFRGLQGLQASQMGYFVGAFRGLRRAVEEGLLDSIAAAVREAVSADDLHLAESVLADHAGPNRSHIAAAVIAGATLERSARAKCIALGIDHRKQSGEPKTLNALIDALRAAGGVTPLREKQMRPWVDIRNAAAHGEFDKFTRQDVEAFLRDLPAVLIELR